MVNWLIKDSATIDRAGFAKSMGAIWIRNFLVRKETYEQMKSSGSLRYIGNIEFLKKMMDYERITNFAQYRNQEFEKKYYTELFIPAVYKSYDLTCQLNLDTSNHSDPVKIEKLANHHDVLTGNDAAVFRHDMGAALTLRLERLRRSLDAFRDARVSLHRNGNLNRKTIGSALNKYYGSTCTYSYRKKKMDTLFLGIFYALSCCPWVFCRKPTGTLYRTHES